LPSTETPSSNKHKSWRVLGIGADFRDRIQNVFDFYPYFGFFRHSYQGYIDFRFDENSKIPTKEANFRTGKFCTSVNSGKAKITKKKFFILKNIIFP
jgi:hypothetical protein